MNSPILNIKFDEIINKGEFESQCPEIKRNIIRCSIGENEKCKTCNIYQTEFCASCNDGYFLDEDDDKTKCKKCSIDGCKVCTNNYCLHCLNDDTEINYPLLTDDKALEKIMEEKNLYNITSTGIYCLNSENPESKYYIWNNYKRKMIEIEGDLCKQKNDLDKYIFENNEYLQAIIHNYQFTYQGHIYERDNKLFSYNQEIANFAEIKNNILQQSLSFCQEKLCVIGENEKCKSCDPLNPGYCLFCNDGYYLPQGTNDDKTKYKIIE